ncbi:GIY-YIG nuclease family protein [soil metagenome]
MAESVTDEDQDLLDELGVDTAPAVVGGRTAREQRIIAGFEEIERFVAEQGRVPAHGENNDIFERIYAVRLDRLRESAECREVLKGLDQRGLLGTGADVVLEDTDDEELLASLGVDATAGTDVTKLVHVRSREEIKAAEEVAQRNPCADFETFKPIFERVQRELESGERQTEKYRHDAEVIKGDFFILDGQKLMVADWEAKFVSDYGRPDRRLRVVFDNGTESDLLMRSLQRALYKDPASRRINKPGDRNLFSDDEEEGDLATGYIYVLRSKSDHPFVAEHRSLIHKIGLTGGDVKSRIANAKKEPTYLLADVEVVATFKLANVNVQFLEGLLHKLFGAARLDLELKDRFGSQVEPREWFLVPLAVIDEAIQKIKDGTIDGFRYDPDTASLTRE